MKRIILFALLALYAHIGYSQEALTAEDYIIAGKSQMAIQNYVRATEYFTKAIAIDNKNVTAYLERGSCKALTNDNIGALADFDIAMMLNPSNPSPFYRIGITKIAMGETKIACSYFDHAKNMGHPDAYEQILKYCK